MLRNDGGAIGRRGHTGKLLSPAAPSPDQEARKQPQHEAEAEAPRMGHSNLKGLEGRSAWGRTSKSRPAPLSGQPRPLVGPSRLPFPRSLPW